MAKKKKSRKNGGLSVEQSREQTKEEGFSKEPGLMDLTKRRKKKKNKDDPTMEDKAGTLDDECKSKQRRRTNPEKGVNTEKGGIPAATPTLTTPPPSAAAAIITGPKEMTALDEEISKTLTHNEWYHGMMPRDSIEDLLKKDGDFLVRKTDVANADRYAISVFFNKRIRHILLGHEDGMWTIRDAKKKTIIELIDFLVETKHQVQADKTYLIAAVPRPEYYILHEHIDLGKKLGGGAFGDVHLGVWKKAHCVSVEVAIKKLKGMMKKKDRAEFVKEARIMRKFNHPNLVQLIGVAPNETPLMIVLELCPGGSLQSHLKKHPEIKEDKLISYCIDACRGMCYLSQRKVIHRDIAARNCLMGKNDECKISDFGLSVANADILKLDKLKSMPVRWLSPETLMKGEFSTKSDVWSYGVMIWEIFARCKSDPFPNESNAQARAKIISGHDPFEAPEGTPLFIQSIMKSCFIQDAQERPDFEKLLKMLSPNELPPPKDDPGVSGF